MDPLLDELLRFSQKARNFCAEFVTTHNRLAKGQAVNELFLVPSLILSRAIRHHDAIELLLRNGFTAEASVIGLTQFELCLDVLYIRDTVTRATEWMKHSSDRFSPWKVKDKIDDIWANDREMRESKQGYFELLSSVKHGNPKAGLFGFPARVVSNSFTITNDQFADVFSRGHAIAVGGVCTYQLVESLQGASAAFGCFVRLDPDLDVERGSLLQECRREIGKAMHSVGLVKSKTLH
jgi:hypothetical protein